VSGPKILVVDIETMAGKGYYWQTRDTTIGLNQIIAPSRVLCAAWKWVGEAGIHFVAEWQKGGPKAMLQALHDALTSADAVVTYNGDRFDITKLTGAFLKYGLKPLPPLTSIDLYKTTKKLGYDSGKMEFVLQYLEIGKKMAHEGFGLWKLVDENNVKARDRMMRYNVHDVRETDKLYRVLRPWIKNHPRLRALDPEGKHRCTACGSTRCQHRGDRHTKAFTIERLQCTKCGKWDDGKRSKK